jgi:hypothetical protein
MAYFFVHGLLLLRGLVFAVVAAFSWHSQDLKPLCIMLFGAAVEDYFPAKNTRRRKKSSNRGGAMVFLSI